MYRSGLHSIIHISSPTSKLANDLAHDILIDDLAIGVCVIPPITIMHKWKRDIISDTEVLMIVKTRTSKVEELLDYVNSTIRTPNQDECKVIGIQVENVNVPYFDWLSDRIPLNADYYSNIIPK